MLLFRLLSLFLFISIFSNQTLAEIKSKEITYKTNTAKNDTLEMKGYFAYDDSIKGKRPAVLVVHEWWGHNDYARKRVKALAKLGYAAFAVDMYGDGKQAKHPKDAGAFAGAVMSDLESARSRFDSALSILKKQAEVNTEKIAAIGYCFGGGLLLQFARAGIELDGIVSFHGSLSLIHI